MGATPYKQKRGGGEVATTPHFSHSNPSDDHSDFIAWERESLRPPGAAMLNPTLYAKTIQSCGPTRLHCPLLIDQRPPRSGPRAASSTPTANGCEQYDSHAPNNADNRRRRRSSPCTR
jgi:hypothetical protein